MTYTMEDNINFILTYANLTGSYVSESTGQTVVQYELDGHSESQAGDNFADAINLVANHIESLG